ncbi:MAG: hypothetical protein ACTSW1_09400 [Candidatus Hodarchaeales archaeon]
MKEEEQQKLIETIVEEFFNSAGSLKLNRKEFGRYFKLEEERSNYSRFFLIFF